jgi:hypothetical protein
MQDILNYIKSAVYSDPRMQKWIEADKELVIDILSRRSGGMYVISTPIFPDGHSDSQFRFRWVYCQLDVLGRCLPCRIRRALDELPKTLDDAYERTLRDIDEQNWEYAHRMFQCITVASRPLRVEELADILAFDFDAGQIPTFFPDWRPMDPKDAVLSTCSSLIVIVKVNRSLVIQFSHLSVKEFLTSSRLATTPDWNSRRFHIPITSAHTLAARASLGILLHLDNKISNDNLKDFPLAEYAARHWVGHARFEDVSSNVQDGIKLTVSFILESDIFISGSGYMIQMPSGYRFSAHKAFHIPEEAHYITPRYMDSAMRQSSLSSNTPRT